MADKETSALTATTTLGGSELVHIVQGGNSRKITVDDISINSYNFVNSGLILPINNSTTLNVLGTISITSGLAAEATGTTDYMSSFQRIRVTGGTATNSVSTVRENSSRLLMSVGFKARVRFGVKTTLTNGRLMAGLNGGFSGSTDISAATNIICVGKDSADTNLQIMTNDGSGTASKIDLGPNFPANTSGTDVYDASFYVPAGGASMQYLVRRLNTGHVATGTVSSDLPTSAQLFNAGFWMGTGATSGSHVGCVMFIISQNLVPF